MDQWKGGVNLDDGRYVRTKFWIPLLHEMTKKEQEASIKKSKRDKQKQHYHHHHDQQKQQRLGTEDLTSNEANALT